MRDTRVSIQETHHTNNKIFYNVTMVSFGHERMSVAYSSREELHKNIRWDSNDNLVPMDICEMCNWVFLEEQKEALESESRAAIRRYVQAQRNRTPEEVAKQRAEARTAMGEGVRMVNVFTGERYIT